MRLNNETAPRRRGAVSYSTSMVQSAWNSKFHISSVLRPEHVTGLLRDDGGLERLHRLGDAFFLRHQAVLMLDRQHPVKADGALRRDEVLPPGNVVAVADGAEDPRTMQDVAVGFDVEVAVDSRVDRVDARVLGVDMEDRAGFAEVAGGGDRVDTLPPEVRRVEVHTDILAGGLAQLEGRLGVVDHEAGVRLDGELHLMSPQEAVLALPVRNKHLLPLPVDALAVLIRPGAGNTVR